MNKPLLTIAIPTYNRAAFLERSLESIFSQVENSFEKSIEIIVSNNASTDKTSSLVEEYSKKYFQISYLENSKNLGPDLNIAQCFSKAKGKYVWIFGDDDLLSPGSLRQVISLLSENELGVLYMNSLWYENEHPEITEIKTISYKSYSEPINYLINVNYWITFITGNIVNKSRIENKVSFNEFKGTNLIQLSWVLPAIFNSERNVVVENALVICKADNTGGYSLIRVFGKNLNHILDYFIEIGYDKRIKSILNIHLLNNFFPAILTRDNKQFNKENYFLALLPIFWKYPSFWKNLFPLLIKRSLKLR